MVLAVVTDTPERRNPMPLRARDLKVGDWVLRWEPDPWTMYNPPPPVIYEQVEAVEVHETYVTVTFTRSDDRPPSNYNMPGITERLAPDHLLQTLNRRPDKQ